MQNKELGFVLKRFLPFKQKLSVLCCRQGKIELITNPPQKCRQLWPGMLIAFDLCNTFKKVHVANNIEIILTPISNQKNRTIAICWLHNLLELCYYFTPLQNPESDLFYHLYNCCLITKFERFFSDHLDIIKKIYLLKFLELIGFYPDKEFVPILNFYEQLTYASIDFNNRCQVESLKRELQKMKHSQIKKMEKWIISCLSSHPQFKIFKTIGMKDEF